MQGRGVNLTKDNYILSLVMLCFFIYALFLYYYIMKIEYH